MKLEKINNNYQVKTETNKLLGYFISDIDGSYYMKFEELSGYWAANTLKEITALLDDVNEPFNKQVIDYFLNEQNEL
jgi:septation ring formation regulator EzrA